VSEAIRVIRYPDPSPGLLGGDADPNAAPRTLFAIWNGDHPVVYANNFLRSLRHLRPNSVRTYASNLLPFVRFLEGNQLDFFDPHVRRTGNVVRLFRNALHALRVREEISDVTAEQYMDAAFLLCRWWTQEGEPALGHEIEAPNRGAINYETHRIVKRPPEWSLPPRRHMMHRDDEAKTLDPQHIEAVWSFLQAERRPKRPKILRTKPGADWSEARRRRYADAKRRWDRQMGLYRRNLAIWGAMIASGGRIGEVPVLTVADILTHNDMIGAARARQLGPAEHAANEDALWLDFRYRPHTEPYGTLKSGGHYAYIGWEERAVRAMRDWIPQRLLVLSQSGETHDLLFTNANGKPLTERAIRRLFATLRNTLEARGELDPTENRGRRKRRSGMYPHLARHTLQTILRSGEVPSQYQQMQLNHKDARTTDQYGTIFVDRVKESMGKFSTRLHQLGQEGEA
jgi:hypothetical protein